MGREESMDVQIAPLRSLDDFILVQSRFVENELLAVIKGVCVVVVYHVTIVAIGHGL